MVTEITIRITRRKQGNIPEAYSAECDGPGSSWRGGCRVDRERCVYGFEDSAGCCITTPVRANQAESLLLGQKTSDDLIKQAADAASVSCCPISDYRASAEYRTGNGKGTNRTSIKTGSIKIVS